MSDGAGTEGEGGRGAARITGETNETERDQSRAGSDPSNGFSKGLASAAKIGERVGRVAVDDPRAVGEARHVGEGGAPLRNVIVGESVDEASERNPARILESEAVASEPGEGGFDRSLSPVG